MGKNMLQECVYNVTYFLLFPLKWNIDWSLINVVASINEEI